MASPTVIKHRFLAAIPSKNNPLSSCFYCSSSTSDDETLIPAAVSILKHHRSKSRWGHLRSLFPSGITPTQFSQITLQIRNNPHLALNFFNFTIHRSLCNHSLLSYSTIIHTLSRGRLRSHAQTLIKSAIIKFHNLNTPSSCCVFESLVKTYRICDSAPFVFDLLIEAYLQSNRIEESIEIVRMLRSRGINPTINTCNSLIRFISKCCGSNNGYDMYKELFVDQNGGGKVVIRVPNAHTFNAIMISFYQSKLWQDVVDVWDEMARVNCVPNVYSYSILMAAYCEDGKIGDAIRVWEEMKVKDLKHDVAAYNTIIGGFCKIGELAKAEEFFREMEVSGLQSTCVTYEHLISGYCKIGDVDMAILLCKDACRKDFRLESFTFDAVIKGFCVKDRISEALEFSRVSVKKHGFIPTRESYEFLIKGLCKEEKMEEALKLQAEMVGKGYAPDLEIYSAFIDGYMKQRNKVQAEKLKIEMTK